MKLQKYAISIVALMCAGTVSMSAFASDLTFVSWGGAYGKGQLESAIKPFSTKTGKQIASEDYSGGLAQIRSQVKTGTVTWDVVDLELQDAIRGCDEGLLEPLHTGDLQAAAGSTAVADDFLPGALTQCAVGTLMWANVVAFDSSKFGSAQPSKIADFFDVSHFPGKRGMKKSPKANLEWALIADGVAPADVYKTLGTPDGLSRAFKKLSGIKANIVWWEAGAQAPQLLADGAVTMTTAYSGRIQGAIDTDKKPFKIIWHGQIPEYETLAIVKGTRNLSLAKEFVKFASSPQVIANETKYIAYGPLRKSALPLVDAATRSKLPSTPENFSVGIPVNSEWWANNGDEINQRFSVWLAN